MARKIEFEATMDIRDAQKSLDALEKKSIESQKRMARLAEKQSEHAKNALETREQEKEARDEASKQERYIKNHSGNRADSKNVKQARQDRATALSEARKAASFANSEEKQVGVIGKELDQEVKQYEALKEAISKARDELAQLYQAEIGKNLVTPEAVSRIRELRTEARQIQEDLAFQNGRNPLVGQFVEANEQIEKTKATIQELQQIIAENNATLANPNATDAQKITATLSNDEANTQLAEETEYLQQMEEQAQELSNALGDGAQQIQEQVERLKEANQEAQNLTQLTGTGSTDLSADPGTIRGADIAGRFQGIADRVRQTFVDLGTIIRDWSSGLLQGAVTGFNALGDALGNVANRAIPAAQAIGGQFASRVKEIGTIAMNTAKSGLQALWNGLKRVGSAAAGGIKNLLGFNKSNKSLGDGLKGGFKTFVKYAFGVRSLYFLFKRLRTAVTEAVKSFAQNDETTAATLSRLSAAMNTMKASWGAAFAPILNMVAPVLETLINLCTRAANAIAALFAALSGASVFKTATTDAEKLGEATSGAGGAAKEAKKQLAGFDELNILSDNDSGGGGGSGATTTYEDNEIPDWARQIKEMFENGQWEELADLAANKLNELVDKIPWGKIGEKIGYWLNAAFTMGARFLLKFDWFKLGLSIAEMINKAIEGVNWKNLGILLVGKFWALGNILAGLLIGINWESVGNALLDILSGAIFGIDWILLANRLVFGVSKVFYGLGNALASRDWAAIGKQLTELVKSFFTDVDWTLLARNVSSFLKRTIEASANLLKGLDFAAIANSIGSFIGNIVSNVDWVGLANSLVEFFKSLFNNAASMFKSGEQNQAFGAKLYIIVRDAIAKIDWGALATSLFNLLGAALGTAVAVVKGFIDQAWEDIKGFFTSAIDEVNLGEDLDGTWIQVGLGILNGIGKAFDAIGTWIKEHIFDPFVNAFKSVFGIHSPSTAMQPLGAFIILGLFNGLKTAFANIWNWLSTNIFEPFMTGIKGLFGIEGGDAKELLSIGTNIINGLKEGISGGVEAVIAVFGEIKDGIVSVLDDAWTTVQSIWSKITGVFDGGEEDQYADDTIPQTAEYIAALEEVRAAKAALNAEINNSGWATDEMSAASYQASIEMLSQKLAEAEASLALAKEAALATAQATGEYSDVLAAEGVILDENGQTVQNTANAVTQMATASSEAATAQQEAATAIGEANASLETTPTSADTAGIGYENLESKSGEAVEALKSDATIIVVDGQELASGLKESTDQAASDFETMHTSISGTLTNTEVRFTTFGERTIGVFNNVLAQIRSVSANITEVVSSMAATWHSDWGRPRIHYPVFSLSGMLDFQTGQMMQIVISDWLYAAKGGIVNGATPLIAGEAGKEAIVPLERNTEWISLVADGLMEKLMQSSFANQLASAFASVPMPAMAGGSVIPPNSTYTGYSGEWNNSLMEEIKALRSEISALASQPIQVSSRMDLDKRQIGKAVTEFQRQQTRSWG